MSQESFKLQYYGPHGAHNVPKLVFSDIPKSGLGTSNATQMSLNYPPECPVMPRDVPRIMSEKFKNRHFQPHETQNSDSKVARFWPHELQLS